MTTFAVLGAQVLFSIATAGAPVRFGVPLPAATVAQGLGLAGSGVLQWRRLPVGGEAPDPVWVEIAIDGAAATARVTAGGGGPCPDGNGPACCHLREERAVACGRERVDRWGWRSGVVDGRRRLEFHVATELEGERFAVGEAMTRWESGGERALAVCTLPQRLWSEALVLPVTGRLGRGVREHLRRVRTTLVEMPGLRGAGDFVRSGGTVTNLEFDTALGLLRLGLRCDDRAALAQGVRAAVQTCDRDLDLRTGLPFVHGPDHRGGRSEGGHSWLQGVLLAGLLTADDDLIAAALAIARGLAARPPTGSGRNERARDFAWPLLELEALLAVTPDQVLAAAADRLATAIDLRFDERCRTWRFGEGEVGDGVYLERAWITGGVVIPALQRHLVRRPDRDRAARLARAQAALLEHLDCGRAGLPTHWRCAGGHWFAEHRAERDPKALLLLDGLPVADLRRLLRREEVRDTIAEVPVPEDPDLPTSFSIVARCGWILR